ncbi:MAG TPA: glycosyltransferase family 9 protein [Candidatus Solibacter sp.]|nr:glycosyltransferase family 9 protein [Candidatus Solibacter sp.]
MERVLENLPQGGRVAIIRLRSLGDCVLTTPALSLLKQFRSDLKVGIAVEPRFRDLFEGHPDVDEILIPEVGAIRAFAPKLCVNFHGGTRSASMTALSGANVRAGFAHFSLGISYNEKIPRAQEILRTDRVVHTAEHLASAMFHFGVPRTKVPRAKLPPYPDGPPPYVKENIAIIHPMATAKDKTWPAANFVAVAEHLKNAGITPVFIGSAEDDLSRFSSYRVEKGKPLKDVLKLIASAAIFVGNDSGPAHIAAAFGVPCVVIFGSSDPAIWGPWRTTGEALHSPKGINSIGVDQVIEAVQRLRVTA